MKQSIIVVAIASMILNFGCIFQRPTDDISVVQVQYNELVRPIVRIKGSAQLPDGRIARWTGSGVVVYSRLNEIGSAFDTYVLTCNHVVETPVFASDGNPNNGPFGPPMKIEKFKYKVDCVEIFNPDGTSRKIGGQVVLQSNNNIFEINKDGDIVVKTEGGRDEETGLPAGDDLALVRLNTSEKIPQVKMMPRKDIDKLRVFFKARVVGCSLGGRPYHTFGEITVLQNGYMSVNAQFVPGNSGGAAYLDSTHEFIGITNTGPNGVWHMGLIRPLQRIYDWMDKGGYTFFYDTLFPEEKRLQILRTDRDRTAIEEENTILEIKQNINQLQHRLSMILLSLQRLGNQAQQNSQNVMEQQENIDTFKKLFEEINCSIDELNKNQIYNQTIEQIQTQLNDLFEVIPLIINKLADRI